MTACSSIPKDGKIAQIALGRFAAIKFNLKRTLALKRRSTPEN